MFGQTISDFLSDLGAPALTDLAIVTMLALWLLALVLSAIGVCRRFTAQTSTILTSLGILGTFGGIVVGLYGFDSSPGRIDASVQTLLEGLKTAFTSSLVGMALAIAYKLLTVMPPFSGKERPPTEPAPAPNTVAGSLEPLVVAARRQADETAAIRETLGGSAGTTLDERLLAVNRVTEQGLGELVRSASLERRLLKSQCDTLERLHLSLVDDDDASLAGQLRQLRAELADQHRSHRAGLDALTRLGEGQAECLRNMLEEQRGAASVRHRIEVAVVAAEVASRAGTAELSDSLPKVLEACAAVAAGTERLDERLQRFAERSEALSTEGNATAVRLLDAVGTTDDSSGVTGELRKLRAVADGGLETARVMSTRADERAIELIEKVEGQARLADEQLAELREHRASAERLVERIGGTDGDSLSEELRALTAVAESGHEAARAASTRADERAVDLIERVKRQVELSDGHLAELREHGAGLERLAGRIGESENGGLSGELREMRAVAESARETQASSFTRLIALAESEENLLTDALELGRFGLDGAARTEQLLRGRMEEIVALLSRSPTEEIIEALKATIREFNEHIAEQFGDNFKQLNEAVGRLLDWQENYREQLGEMHRQYEVGVQAITDTERSVGEISRHSAAIPTNMEKLGTVLAANDSELVQLRDHLAAFAEAREQAVRAVPEITAIVGETVRRLDEAGRSLSGGVQSSAESMTSAIQKSADDYTRMADTVNGNVQAIAQRTQDETARLFGSLEGSIKEAYRLTSESTENLVKQEFSQMETAREEQIKRIMQEMGVALASITGKFTEDYSRLVDAMDRVVRTGSAPGRDAA